MPFLQTRETLSVSQKPRQLSLTVPQEPRWKRFRNHNLQADTEQFEPEASPYLSHRQQALNKLTIESQSSIPYALNTAKPFG